MCSRSQVVVVLRSRENGNLSQLVGEELCSYWKVVYCRVLYVRKLIKFMDIGITLVLCVQFTSFLGMRSDKAVPSTS